MKQCKDVGQGGTDLHLATTFEFVFEYGVNRQFIEKLQIFDNLEAKSMSMYSVIETNTSKLDIDFRARIDPSLQLANRCVPTASGVRAPLSRPAGLKNGPLLPIDHWRRWVALKSDWKYTTSVATRLEVALGGYSKAASYCPRWILTPTRCKWHLSASGRPV